MKYGKLIDGKIVYAPKELKIENTYYPAPTDEQYLSCGWFNVIDTKLSPQEGYHVSGSHYEVLDGKIVRVWKYEQDVPKPEPTPHVPTQEDYDAVMEDHLTQEREERGYTTREPSEYVGSSVPRWAQDAADWIAHRDAVMVYALGVINTYKETGVAPSLEEFREALPKIVWTYTEA